MASLIAQVDRANDALQEARSDVRTARLETQTAREEIKYLVQALKEANVKLDENREEIAGLRTTLKILVGIIVAGFVGIVGLMLQTTPG
jgi:chromosome segregation ATPase